MCPVRGNRRGPEQPAHRDLLLLLRGHAAPRHDNRDVLVARVVDLPRSHHERFAPWCNLDSARCPSAAARSSRAAAAAAAAAAARHDQRVNNNEREATGEHPAPRAENVVVVGVAGVAMWLLLLVLVRCVRRRRRDSSYPTPLGRRIFSGVSEPHHFTTAPSGIATVTTTSSYSACTIHLPSLLCCS